MLSPVEGPVEQKDLGSFRQGDGIVLIGLQYLWDNTAQPAGPLLQRVLLQQSHLEILLQAQHYPVFTLTNPGCLLLRTEWTVSGLFVSLKHSRQDRKCSTDLDIVEVNTVEVWEHLVDVGWVLEDSVSCLSQVVQACVAAQHLGEWVYTHHLRRHNNMTWNKWTWAALTTEGGRTVNMDELRYVIQDGIHALILTFPPFNTSADWSALNGPEFVKQFAFNKVKLVKGFTVNVWLFSSTLAASHLMRTQFHFSTFTRTISSGMFIIAPVNQFSRLLAKLRIAWVKAPGGGYIEIKLYIYCTLK